MLNAFKDYLVKTAHVKAKHIPYYIKWVADWYAFFDVPNSQLISNNHRKQFFETYVKELRGLAGEAG